jgi:hypothetical protein
MRLLDSTCRVTKDINEKKQKKRTHPQKRKKGKKIKKAEKKKGITYNQNILASRYIGMRLLVVAMCKLCSLSRGYS